MRFHKYWITCEVRSVSSYRFRNCLQFFRNQNQTTKKQCRPPGEFNSGSKTCFPVRRRDSFKWLLCVWFCRLKELDQILFTNSARNMPHLFWSNRGKNPVATRRTNPYLSRTAKPGIHQLARNIPDASSDVYRATTVKKEQSMRTGLVSMHCVICTCDMCRCRENSWFNSDLNLSHYYLLKWSVVN